MNLLAYVHLRNIVNSTGAGRVARQMTECLAKIDGLQLRVLADAADHGRFVAAAGEPWTSFDYRLFKSDTSRQQAIWYLSHGPAAESYWPDAQVVYCTAESYVPVRKARLVVTMHDAAHFENGAHARTAALWRQRMKWRLLFRRLAKEADLFHTVSQFSADRLGHFFPEIRQRLRVVHNAVSDRFFSPSSAMGEAWLQQAGLKDRKYVLVPGGLHYRKNAELVLDTWPRLAASDPDLVMVIVNHNDPVYSERARQLGDRVRLAGYVCDEQLCALYSNASVVWFPSRYEGFGLPALEAMACGAPVVGSNSSAIPEVCGDAATLVDPADPEQHAEALRWLLNDEAARASQILRGKQRATQFRWPIAARQLHTQFQSLI